MKKYMYLGILILLFIAKPAFAPNLSKYDYARAYYPWMNKQYYTVITHIAKINNISRAEIFAIIHAESEGNTKAVSRCKARGLMQIMAKYHYKGKNPKDLFKPKLNITIGAKYYKWCKTFSKGNMKRALIAYNAGPNCKIQRYKNWGYVNKIMKCYNDTHNII
jgi:soluble lytic murein transglycosylase-like protein